jgi:hypothetical protein
MSATFSTSRPKMLFFSFSQIIYFPALLLFCPDKAAVATWKVLANRHSLAGRSSPRGLPLGYNGMLMGVWCLPGMFVLLEVGT